MVSQGISLAWKLIKAFSIFLIPIVIAAAIFAILCLSWFLVFKYYFKLEYRPSGIVPVKKMPWWKQVFYEVPKRYVMDV